MKLTLLSMILVPAVSFASWTARLSGTSYGGKPSQLNAVIGEMCGSCGTEISRIAGTGIDLFYSPTQKSSFSSKTIYLNWFLGLRYELLSTAVEIRDAANSLQFKNTLARGALLGGLNWRRRSFSWGVLLSYGLFHEGTFQYYNNGVRIYEGKGQSSSYGLGLEGAYHFSRFAAGVEGGIASFQNSEFKNKENFEPSAGAALNFKQIDYLGPYLKFNFGVTF